MYILSSILEGLTALGKKFVLYCLLGILYFVDRSLVNYELELL